MGNDFGSDHLLESFVLVGFVVAILEVLSQRSVFHQIAHRGRTIVDPETIAFVRITQLLFDVVAIGTSASDGFEDLFVGLETEDRNRIRGTLTLTWCMVTWMYLPDGLGFALDT
jgi:hypothetical protein